MKQRSPIIFWLLLAATLCLDAAAAMWSVRVGGRARWFETFLLALLYAQLSALCIWAVLCHARIGLLWLVPFAAGFLAVLALVACNHISDPEVNRSVYPVILGPIGVLWLHVAITLSTLWALKPTRLFTGYARMPGCVSWQFTVMHLLVLMTGSSILLALLTSTAELGPPIITFTLVSVGSVILTVFLAILVQTKLLLLLRLAANLGAAFAIGIVIGKVSMNLPHLAMDYIAFYLIQAVLTWSWVEVLYPRCVIRDQIANDDKMVRDTT